MGEPRLVCRGSIAPGAAVGPSTVERGTAAQRSVLVGGTVRTLDPLAGLRAAAEEDVPAGAALASFTVAPAWLSFDEERRGLLRAGFDADLVVLDGDPLGDPPASVAEARAVATMVAGDWVHSPGW
jgi:imidazolonepropionase-like amidohydrolase